MAKPVSSGAPLKVGITCYPSVGGSGIIATMLGKELALRGHEVHFISYERPFRLPEDAPNIYFHPVIINDYNLFKYPDYTLPLSVKMTEVSRNHHLDILHVHYAVPHATAAILSRCMLRPDEQPRVVTTLHGTDMTLLGNDPGYGPAILHALNQSDAVTTVSQFLKRETRRVLDFSGSIEVIPNFFDASIAKRSRDEIRAELGVTENEALIIHSSNLRPGKRIDFLLETLSLIRPRASFKVLVLAGESFAPFQPEVERLGLKDRCIVLENILDVENYLQAADLGLITSENESFCLSILEAMTLGCPSVATAVGGIPELVLDQETGFLVPFGDPRALARAVERLIGDIGFRSRLGVAARADAEKKFSSKVIVPLYESLYRKVVG